MSYDRKRWVDVSVLGPLQVHYGFVTGSLRVRDRSVTGPLWVRTGDVAGPLWVRNVYMYGTREGLTHRVREVRL